MSAQKDPYKVLGVARNATQEQIKKAYRDLARKHHPDMNRGDKTSEERFKEIQHAYETLSDPEKKRAYDTFGTAGFGGGAQGGRARYSRGFPSMEEIFGDIFAQGGFGARGAGGGFGEVFDFGQARRPRRPRDVRRSVTLDFRDAVGGAEKEILVKPPGEPEKKITVKIPAGVDTGSKVRIPGRGERTDSGTGDLILEVRVSPHPVFRREGDDVYLDLPLTVYEAALGTRVDVPTVGSPVRLTIPPGIASGTKMRLRGKGAKNPRTGKTGDQFAVVQIAMPEKPDEGMEKLMGEMAEKYPYDPRKKLLGHL